MESKDISLTIIGVVTILAILVICYTAISKHAKFSLRLSNSMKFFIASAVFVLLAGFDLSSKLNLSFITIALGCYAGCIWTEIMDND